MLKLCLFSTDFEPDDAFKKNAYKEKVCTFAVRSWMDGGWVVGEFERVMLNST